MCCFNDVNTVTGRPGNSLAQTKASPEDHIGCGAGPFGAHRFSDWRNAGGMRGRTGKCGRGGTSGTMCGNSMAVAAQVVWMLADVRDLAISVPLFTP